MTVWSIIGIVLVVVAISLVIKAMTRVVPHEERLAIYRLGHFDRVAGPGPVVIIPWMDEVKRTFRVRDRPLEVAVDGLLPYGVPIGMTLNLWCRFDLVQAARGNRDRLGNLVQLSEGERRQQVEIKVREALVRQIANSEESSPLPGDATLIDRVMALAPGTRRYYQLLDAVKRELQETLPSVGAILVQTQSITLTRRDISDEIIQAAKRTRSRAIDSEWLKSYVDEVRERFPGLSDTMLIQLLASIEGVDVGRVQRLLLEKDPDTKAKAEFEMSGDQERPNVIVTPEGQERSTIRQAETAPVSAEGTTASRSSRPLTKSDLTVLKRVPRREHDQRTSA